jgi:hypothetical protein
MSRINEAKNTTIAINFPKGVPKKLRTVIGFKITTYATMAKVITHAIRLSGEHKDMSPVEILPTPLVAVFPTPEIDFVVKFDRDLTLEETTFILNITII